MKDVLEGVEALLTSMALIIGAAWSYLLFVKRRQRFPRAQLTQELIQKRLSEKSHLLRVVLRIKNLAEVLLELESGEVRVQQVLPAPNNVLTACASGQNAVAPSESEIEWPLLGVREFNWKGGELEIEPGESDELVCDFVVEPEIETVQIYSYLKNKSKKAREIGWACTTLHDTPAAIGKEGQSTTKGEPDEAAAATSKTASPRDTGAETEKKAPKTQKT